MRREKSPQRTPVRDSGYAIGYGKPPIGSRFKPGQTGNAKGRSKGHKNLKTLIRQAMTARISVQEGSSNRQVSKIEGVVLRQLQNALKGNDRSAMAVIRMALQLGFLDDVADRCQAEEALSATDERILKELMARREGKRR
jgi:Family of unknown function (DUF5681)